jgi:hypothetical protein
MDILDLLGHQVNMVQQELVDLRGIQVMLDHQVSKVPLVQRVAQARLVTLEQQDLLASQAILDCRVQQDFRDQ